MIGPRVEVVGRSWSAFRALGVAGFALATAVALVTGGARGLSPVVTLALVAVSVVVFLALALATKVVTGEEQLIYLHHQIAVVGACAAVAALLGRPVLAHLDGIALGLGAFLVLGRLGCLVTGCCHGRPAERGPRYGAAHVATSVPDYLAGLRLVPVQALESAWVLAVVALGTGMVLAGAEPGAALGAYVVAYGAGRSALERLRGDAARPHAWRLSEAQWLSLAMGALVVAAWVAGALPAPLWPWAWGLLLLAGGALGAFAVRRWWRPTHPLLHPRHAREVLEAPEASRILVRETSAGVRVSRDERHFSFSSARGSISEADAEDLAALVGGVETVAGVAGVIHVLR